MKHQTAYLILITTLFAPGFAFSEHDQNVKINGAVVKVRDGAVANPAVKKQTVPFLGVYAVPIKSIVAKQLNLPAGLYLSVEQAISDSPAAKAGLERFDVLMKFDDQILVNQEQLQALVRSKKEGDSVKLLILRGGKEKNVEVVLGEQEVPEAASVPSLPLPGLGNPRFDFGDQGFPFGPDADANARALNQWMKDRDGNLDLPFGLGDDFRERLQRQLQRHRNQLGKRNGAIGPELNDPELLEKYDVDGDGKLSRIERDKARDEGAIPEPNLDLDFNFGLGIPNAGDLLRDARRRGAANAWSSVSGSAQTKVVTMDETGSYEFSSNDGKKRFKVTSRDGEVLFDGPVNTEEERAKVPEALRQRLDSIESNVKIHVHPKPDRKAQPQKQNKKGKPKKDQLL